jgi:hypothetical protein
LAVATLLTGMLIGSAIVAALDTSQSGFRRDLADIALVVWIVVAAVAAVLAVALLWRLIRPHRDR